MVPSLCRRSAKAATASSMLLGAILISAPSSLFVSSFQTARSVQKIGRHQPFHTNIIDHHNQHLNSNRWEQQRRRNNQDGSSTSLNFMGSDGGLFGIGTPELATILLVGYFVLGPSDLYKLVKEIGKFVNNIRTLGTQATAQFETSMESQLELGEIRKAQRELNDAFSFRRSINTEDGPVDPPFAEAEVPPVAAAAAATAVTAEDEATPKRKKRRRRVKKKVSSSEQAVNMDGPVTNNIPDLDMSDAFPEPPAPSPTEPATSLSTTATTKKDTWYEDDDIPSASDMAKEDLDWLTDLDDDDKDSEATTSSTPELAKLDPAAEAQQQSRFQQQMSESWNQKVMDNEDKLAPLALIMERLAILEEEKATAERRLEDEFRERFQLEEDYYEKKRAVLEESAAKVQEEAYVTMDGGDSK